jgi:two-component system, chemotaxis family, protein-glutamate methylesterase/glutaminase
LINLLVVDDSALMRKLLGKIFAAEADFHLRFARNGMEALEEIRREKPDVVTLDIHMPDMDGLTCLDRIMVEQPCPVVMFSALSAEGAAITLDALRRGAVDFVAKPSGAVSLEIDALSAELVAKVRAASTAHLRGSLRLKERVRYRIGGEVFATRPKRHIPRSTGDGLVLVGTSTGGPPALEALLVPLPADFPWPIVVVQHMPESFTGPLARRLDGLCALSVTEVQATSLLRPACVYIARGDADILISSRSEGLFAVSVAADRDYPWHPSTDRLVRSALREVAASQLIGILMTGMGDDGAQAMADLHAQGGKTIAEAEETAVVWGMPGELVKAGGADWVLPLPAIAARLQRLTP